MQEQQQTQQQELQKIHHSLSRLALAKAIKTPDDKESDPWQKSVIFNQPFIKELHQKRQQLYTKPSPPRRERVNENKPQAHRRRKPSSNSSSIEKRLSELNIKKSTATEQTKKQRSCLPSDSEEDDEEETNDDEDEEEEDNASDSSDVLQVEQQQRPVSSSQAQIRPTSVNSSRDDISTPSRGSISSNAFPLTDEDEVDTAPNAPLHHIRSNSWALPHGSNDSLYNSSQQKPSYNYNHQPNNNMVDPMYYQRLQYQQQLQYQLQYQQALALQQQQQQQLYMLSQSPSAFFPPGSRVAEDAAPLSYIKKRHSGLSQQHGKSNHGPKMSKTDLRRREEMLRSSNDSMHRLPPQQAMYYQQQAFTPSIMKSNNRRPSYNL